MRSPTIRIVTMASVALLAGVLAAPDQALAAFPGANGKIAFSSAASGNNEIYSMNADGTGGTKLTSDPAVDVYPAWSADGSKIAFMSNRADPSFDIYSMNADGSGVTRLTTDSSIDIEPAWSADGTKVAFARSTDGINYDVYAVSADGTGALTQLTTDPSIDDQPAWSPDGTKIAFESYRDGNYEIYSTSADGSGVPARLTTDPSDDSKPNWSPDGTKIAFVSDRGGDYDIYSMNADGTGTPTDLTNDPDTDVVPAWSPDGTKIAFESNRGGKFQVYSANADGSGVATQLTTDPALTGGPDWQPVVALFTATFLQPLTESTDAANPVINTGKNGRVIPVKVQLSQSTTAITDQNAPGPVAIQVSKIASCSATEGSDPVEAYADAGQSSAGTNQFRYGGGAWIYNLDTRALGLTTGNCYRIGVSVNGTPVTNAFAVFQPTR